jgi:hypothetical protein
MGENKVDLVSPMLTASDAHCMYIRRVLIGHTSVAFDFAAGRIRLGICLSRVGLKLTSSVSFLNPTLLRLIDVHDSNFPDIGYGHDPKLLLVSVMRFGSYIFQIPIDEFSCQYVCEKLGLSHEAGKHVFDMLYKVTNGGIFDD